MKDRHKAHKWVASDSQFGHALCNRRDAKFTTNDNYKVTCKACQKILSESKHVGRENDQRS